MHVAVDELVSDEIADYQHAAAAEAVDERQQPRLAFGFPGQWMNGSSDLHSE
jgi:hypothetical protein